MTDGEHQHQVDFEYDVCLSFAGEDRVYVRKVADRLVSKGVRVFYDEYEEVTLWGKDLFQHLDYIYKEAARFCVVFISKSYEKNYGQTTKSRVRKHGRSHQDQNFFFLCALMTPISQEFEIQRDS